MRVLSFFTLIFLVNISYSQIEFEGVNGLVRTKTYSKKIATDFNYLILGENSPQQGISATLNDKKSNIKINGLLYAGSTGLLSMEADLSASNGIYFFDQENGSEQGKITLNYFTPVKRWSEFYNVDVLTKTTNNLQILDLISKTKNEYESLLYLIRKIEFEDEKSKNIIVVKATNEDDEAYEKLRKITDRYINSNDVLGFNKIKKEQIDTMLYYKKLTAKKVDKDKEKSEKLTIKIKGNSSKIIVNSNENLKLAKLLKDYQLKRNFILKKLEDSINKMELDAVKTNWAGNHIIFLGVSPFYERQSFNRFTYNNEQTFKEMFEKERGNIYGVTLSFNYSLEKGAGSRNIYKPESLFLRLASVFSRTSNLSNFKNSTLDLTTPLGNDVNGNPITFTATDNAFIGDATYEYGFGFSLIFDIYYYPFSLPVGLFGIIGYNHVGFNKTSILKDINRNPMRLGLLFSLANKEKKKPAITIQAFLDRTDLALSPNGTDNDLRFGIGLGLPINF